MDVNYYSQSYCQRILHQELALQWVVSSGVVKDLAMSNAWSVRIYLRNNLFLVFGNL